MRNTEKGEQAKYVRGKILKFSSAIHLTGFHQIIQQIRTGVNGTQCSKKRYKNSKHTW